MNIMVVDVAAQHGGAATILEQFVGEFKSDSTNDYVVVLSTMQFEDCSNIKFINFPWVKKSYLHRLWFDVIYSKKLVRKYKPDKILSLQNCTISAGKVEQEVYFHNPLPISDIKYKLNESKSIWIYQNILGRYWKNSLKKASKIYVQAEWIKRALITKWNQNEENIIVKTPVLDVSYSEHFVRKEEGIVLFYPASTAIYKNHSKLLEAFSQVCEELKDESPTLVLTGNGSGLSEEAKHIVDSNDRIKLVGRLARNEMIEMYCKSTLIFPSLIETFGLPLLEAKTLGCFILANDAEYAHAVISNYDKVKYFDAKNTREIKKAIVEYVRWRLANGVVE